ncbi:hypothetical protein [Nocardia asiatica]|uniref:hypothetical protein n=1 Tax=Nocardia asiatica TaxID=209252 RepID=UPI003EE31DAE
MPAPRPIEEAIPDPGRVQEVIGPFLGRVAAAVKATAVQAHDYQTREGTPISSAERSGRALGMLAS